MDFNTEKIISLLYKRLTGDLSPEEEKILADWENESPENKDLAGRLADNESLGDLYRKRALVNTSRPRQEMEKRLGLNRSYSLKALAYGSVAAAILAGIIVVAWLFSPTWPGNGNQNITAEVKAETTLNIDSLKAGSAKAFISDGSNQIQLTEEPSSPTKISSLISSSNKKGPLKLEVPKGGEFMVILDDSTKVWLNSSSILIYPENFSADSRRVRLEGEAYFVVAKEKDQQPFFVECDGQEIKVYGTEFNVRSYPEDESVFTSLSKGSVAVRRADTQGGELFISPGTQAIFDKKTKEAKVRPVNIETVTGWRHGRFVFEDQTLLQIMNDLGRWYDFEFEFADTSLKDTVFMGSIPRYSDFSTAMLILEKSGNVTFKLDNGKIIVDKKK